MVSQIRTSFPKQPCSCCRLVLNSLILSFKFFLMARGRKPKAKVEKVAPEVEVVAEISSEVEVVPEAPVEPVPEVVEEVTASAPEVEVVVESISDGLVTVEIPGIGTRRGKAVLINKREHVEIKEPTHTFLVHKSLHGDHYEV